MSEALRQRLFAELDALSLIDPHTHIDAVRPASETLADLLRESMAVVGFAALLFYYDAGLALVCLTGAPLVLYPLVRDGRASVLPMQRALSDKPWLLEICPASTLKREGMYWPYKGKTDAHRAARASILERLEATGTLSIPIPAVRSAVLEDRGGDALDSVIAALAAFRALHTPVSFTLEGNDAYRLEGYVYVYLVLSMSRK